MSFMERRGKYNRQSRGYPGFRETDTKKNRG